MNQDDFNYKSLEQLKIIAERLESIERMLGEDKTQIDGNQRIEVITDILLGREKHQHGWHSKESAPDGKMLRICVTGTKGKNVGHIGIKLNPYLWKAWKLSDNSPGWFIVQNTLVAGWREMNIEESAYAWENRILGASEEHAELSTLELPIAKPDPEWRPMSTAPRDREIIVNFQSVAYRANYYPYGDLWKCTRGDRQGLMYHFRSEQLTGWRPL